MSQAAETRPVREGSAAKRRAILDAARELFVRDGVDRVSMDAVSAAAGVSKATVYDYFGNKRRLVLAIFEDASEALDTLGRQVLDEYLPEDVPITTLEQLERALTDAAIDLGTAMVGSADYAAVFALAAQQRRYSSDPADDVSTEAVELVLAERIAQYVEIGLLDTDRPRLAAEHFATLTLLLAHNQQPNPDSIDPERVRQTMVDGVRLFIRGYAAR